MMKKDDHEILEHYQEEIREYQADQENIKKMLGAIGGSKASRREKWISVLLIIAMIATFGMGYVIPGFSKYLSIELGVLLVSIKVIMIMHQQQKMQHFQFWILNSIEWKITNLEKRQLVLKRIMEQVQEEEERMMKALEHHGLDELHVIEDKGKDKDSSE